MAKYEITFQTTEGKVRRFILDELQEGKHFPPVETWERVRFLKNCDKGKGAASNYTVHERFWLEEYINVPEASNVEKTYVLRNYTGTHTKTFK